MSLAILVTRSAGFEPIGRTLEEERLAQVNIAGAARPFFVASLVSAAAAGSSGGQPQFVLYCAQQRQAEQWVSDLQAFGVEALPFPPWDTLPSERLSPAVEIVAARMRALAGLERGGVIVVPARGALYPVPAPSEGLHATATIGVGESHDLVELGRLLQRLGYSREVRVEQQGQFAQRGGIVDLYPPHLEQPVRVEFFGDTVESVRFFHPVSQTSTGEAGGFELTALREVAVDEERGRQAADLLRGQLAAHEWLRRDVERLDAGEDFAGVEAYLPFLYGKRGSLNDYLRSDATVLVDEPSLCFNEMQRILRDEGSYLEEAAASGAIPAPPVPYIPLLEEAVEGAALRSCQERVCPRDKRCVSLYSIAGGGLSAPSGKKAGAPVKVKAEAAEFAARDHETITNTFEGWLRRGVKVVVAAASEESARRLTDFLKSLGFPAVLLAEPERGELPALSVAVGSLEHGFSLPDLGLVVVTQHDLFGSPSRRRGRVAAGMEGAATRPLRSLSELEPGDYVVHINHGIGRYAGLTKRDIGGATKEYLLIEFQGEDRLFLPVDSLDRITKYIGSGDEPHLSKLGGSEWRRTKAKVKKSLRKLAINLVKLYAERARAAGHGFAADSPWQRELEESFPFEETPDQLRAIVDVKDDMERSRPMDRLVCGDVGYGKTEVALRAAFKAVQEGKQALVLVPTTLLAQQHFSTFSERFEPFPIRVELLSRFRTPAEQKKVVKAFASGEADVVIGTHRVLSKDLAPKDLGLIVIDEEHRFGVGQKEQLRQMRKQVDVLAMTATPIPRTLQMSLSGIRDLSIIETPPPDRQPILTFVGEWEPTLVRAAIRREMAREGQIFYVHNRVQDIDQVAARVSALVPEARVRIAHGQMSEKELERIMAAFTAREFDILVCTVIIEAGLDLPNANTLIVENADRFGLAQLYQLRGRVGRSGRRAYAYFLVSPGASFTFAAGERLRTLGELTQMGAGLKLAMKDLEIRGAGNLLGAEQHGHIAEVGFELYADLLRQEVAQLQQAAEEGLLPAEVAADIAAGFAEARSAFAAGGAGGELAEDGELPEIRIDLPVDAFVPESYIEEEILRIEVYGRIARIAGDEDAEAVLSEVRDRFGVPRQELLNLVEVCRLRSRAARLGLERITWSAPRGISAGKLALHPVSVGKAMWDGLRERVGRFNWQRLERTIEFTGVEAPEALPRALAIVDAMTEISKP